MFKAIAAKLFQCEQKYAMLVRINDEYVSLAGSTLNTIRIVDSAVAEAQKAILHDQSGVSFHANQFTHKDHCAAGDRAKLNRKADISFAEDMGPGWESTVKSSKDMYQRNSQQYNCDT